MNTSLMSFRWKYDILGHGEFEPKCLPSLRLTSLCLGSAKALSKIIPMLLRGELSETPGYQTFLSDGPKNMCIFWSRIHVNVFFLDWCIFPCIMIKQGTIQISLWDLLRMEVSVRRWTMDMLPVASGREAMPTGVRADVNGSSFDLQKKH